MLTPTSRKFPGKQIPMIQITLDSARVQFLLRFTSLVPRELMNPFIEGAVSRLSLVLATPTLSHAQINEEDRLSLTHDVSYLLTYLILADSEEVTLFQPYLVIWGLLEAEVGEFFDYLNNNSLSVHLTGYDHLIKTLHLPHNYATPLGPPCASILAIISGVESYLSIVCGSTWHDANKARHQMRRSLG